MKYNLYGNTKPIENLVLRQQEIINHFLRSFGITEHNASEYELVFCHENPLDFVVYHKGIQVDSIKTEFKNNTFAIYTDKVPNESQ